jgi:UDP-N-acetylglucosamine 2-epimerase (non-hydrolysing)
MRILTVFGTRPEAIKMAPVVHALERDPRFESVVCVTGQHKQMLESMMQVFAMKADINLNIMKDNQTLNDVAASVISGIDRVIAEVDPEYILVQGDTASTMAAALAAFFRGKKIGHIEAGLRTGNLFSPWPEEANRRLATVVSTLHFAPTERAKQALLAEGVPPATVLMTGNTVIDALHYMVGSISQPGPLRDSLEAEFAWLHPGKKLILVTGHRRESFGDGFLQICEAIREIAARPDVQIVYPVHLNPNVQQPVNAILSGLAGVHLIPPLDYQRFVYLMHKSHFIVTDSGGVQEEAPAIRKPVLVMRDTSERMEAVEAGVARLVGADRASIVRNVHALMDDPALFAAMASGASPFGDGQAARRILDALAG